MPLITFVRDVTLPGEPGGPHYTHGYCVDVPAMLAAAHVKSGDAVYGAVAPQADAAPAHVADEVVEVEARPRGRRRF